MDQNEKAAAAIGRAEAAGLLVQYDRGFLVFTSTDQRRGDLEQKRAVVEQLGACASEVRRLAIAHARNERGREIIGERVLVPVIGIGERSKEDPRSGQIVRSQIWGNLEAVNGAKDIEVSHIEAGDDSRTCKSWKHFDECFIVLAGDPSNRARSIPAAVGDAIRHAIADGDFRRALDIASSVGITIEHNAGFAIVRLTTEDQAGAKEILREFGCPNGNLQRILETRARVAAGADFLGRIVFVPEFGAFGILESVGLDGRCTAEYLNERAGTRMSCFVNGETLLILPGDFEDERQAEMQPATQKPESWWRSLVHRARAVLPAILVQGSTGSAA